MTVPLRLGIFGAGQAFQQLYAPAIALRPELVVAATADPVAPADFPGPVELLDGSEIDAVIVLSPARLHAEQVALATGRGLPVLVEKPPAVSVAEADGWDRPELVTPAFSRRYWKLFRQPRLECRRFAYSIVTNPEAWGAQHVESPVRDLLPHAADLAIWVSGSTISSVVEVSRTSLRVSGAFNLANGARFDWHLQHGTTYAESLVCDGKALPSPVPGRVGELLRRARRQPTEAVNGVAALLADWAASFDGARPPSLPGIEAARSCAAAIETVEGVASVIPS
ncbi:MAG: Gfo/Idh/MocA family protein [Dehalococcoidia bacterium]